ncbi:sulfotransferase family protein [Nitzschia inconspicua]|uniref:Sulfotransferase family protein n=1 Tax=Nitzschia inconspicua TaxID=303405 RepID=A0A9K3KIL5_9STRA|nr:sulfotransferase family protein [Nitzschia inconspicua]
MTATDSTDHDAAIHNNNNNNNKEVRPASPLPEMPLLPITSPETIQACRNLTVTDRDIFVCSYPKSGTTWTQNLVVRLLAAHVNMELPLDWHLSHSAPFYEVNQYWDVVQGGRVPAKTPIQKSGSSSGKNDTYRVFNTHLRLHQLPPNAKCVYVMRDGMDVLVSFYHHLVHMNESDGGYTGSPEDFCKDFLNGTIAYGLWEDHIEAWLKETSTARTSSNNGGSILFLHYHEMRQNLKKEAARLSKFLGVADADMDRVLAAALPSCTFDAMKQERWRYTPQSVSWKADPQTGQPYDKFVRKGRVGDGKMFLRDVFTPTLFEKWTDNQKRAQRRWKAAGVDPSIIDLYLQRKYSSSPY